MVFFMVDQFRKEAELLYKQLPYENNELYKRYQMKFDLPEYTEEEFKEGEEWKSYLKRLEEELGLKFDVVVHNGIALHKLSEVSPNIRKMEADGKSELEKIMKRLHNEPDKFVAYTCSKSRLVIDIREDGNRTYNILFINTSKSLPVVFNITASGGAKLTVNELFVAEGKEPIVSGCVQNIDVGDASYAELNMLHLEGKESDVFTVLEGNVGAEGKMATNLINAGGNRIRYRSSIDANGNGGKVQTNNIIIGFDAQRIDIAEKTKNINEGTESLSDTRAIMMGNSAAVIKGFSKIEKGARRSVSRINERGVVNGNDAYIYLIPDMSIDESDVVATHAGAAAPIDKDEVFYMQSRGIDEDTARFLIMAGFLSGSIGRISSDWIKSLSYSAITERIRGKGFGIPKAVNISDLWINGARR